MASKQKPVSIFEGNTDSISEGSKDVVFGHKSTITTGRSGLVLAVEVHDDNAPDSTLVEGVIQMHKDFYETAPRSTVFDGVRVHSTTEHLLNRSKLRMSAVLTL